MSLVASGLAIELIVNHLDSGILVRLSDGHVLVSVVDRLAAQTLDVNEVADACGLNGLTAAVDTTAHFCKLLKLLL